MEAVSGRCEWNVVVEWEGKDGGSVRGEREEVEEGKMKCVEIDIIFSSRDIIIQDKIHM